MEVENVGKDYIYPVLTYASSFLIRSYIYPFIHSFISVFFRAIQIFQHHIYNILKKKTNQKISDISIVITFFFPTFLTSLHSYFPSFCVGSIHSNIFFQIFLKSYYVLSSAECGGNERIRHDP